MAFLRYRITPLSGFATPLRSDTLHGHFLCAAALLKGDSLVQRLIQSFESKKPAFVMSSAFPKGMLPMPLLPPIKRQVFKKEFGGNQEKLFEHLNKFKVFRKKKFIPYELWSKKAGSLKQETLFRAFLQDEKAFEPARKEAHFQPHNSIDRRTNTVLEQGGLFFKDTHFYDQETVLELYARVQDEEVSLFKELFELVRESGFGADASTGKGRFDLTIDETFEPKKLFKSANGKWRMNLSVCAMEQIKDIRGYYTPFVKQGKVWNGFGDDRPFKKPFLAFNEGSVFQSLPSQGYLLKNVHQDPKVVQVTWPLTLPCQVKEDS